VAEMYTSGKIKRDHLIRKAYQYIRQSSLRQVYENTESTKRQYALKEKLIAFGWDESQIEVIDSDLGQSGADSGERYGFQYLMSEVSLGHAGIIAGLEVSRLSRSSSDWNKLLQIAALSDTLIMDEDGIYNVNDFNDRLLLGLKGTLSEAELHYLKSRMRGGLLNKAKRGELMRPVAIGYVYDDDGQIAKDPDAQVREAITLFFNTFRRVGSARSVVSEYEKQGFTFPHRPFKGFKLGELSWKKLTSGRALAMLNNPLYAGVYAYGITQIKHTMDGPQVKHVPKEHYHAWLPGSHPGYISEAEFEENLERLAKNSHPKPKIEHGGAVREGSALLQGIALCGNCGRLMTLRYSQSKYRAQPIYMCQHESVNHGGPVCQYVPGGNIDQAVGDLLLEIINPMTTDVAVSIQREMAERKEEILKLYSQQMERAQYEMELSKRRYLRVDPDNRLVAAELEYDWNQKIREYESAKIAYDQKCEAEIQIVDEELRASLDRLVADFPQIWNDPQTSHKEKKRIARLILEDVTIKSNSSSVVLGIRFQGGTTRVLELPNTGRSLKLAQIEQDAVAEITALIPLGLTNRQIADKLNEKGFITEIYGKPYSKDTVNWLITKHGLSSRISVVESSGWLTSKEKMEELGISEYKLTRMRRNGELTFKVSNINGTAYLYKPAEPAIV